MRDRSRARRLAAGGLVVALGLAGAASAEYAAAHPRRAEAPAGGDFEATMDRAFGPGRWRKTSGFRTQAQEDALRREGAGTVAPGRVSKHSIGGADAPSAYDAVVERMSLASAAARLKRAGGPVARVVPERAHGRQGPHLHIELATDAAPSAASEADAGTAKPRRGRPT
jgi:hypothetical protein